ncbi:ISSod4, transposase [Clostridium perfringens D str. JGS1721]|uniref:ISSod4, transposase n=1 Tax=Clostridium perfringens D str. JGS1721 TaxID=488537 RepID=B1V643_CLOPF|nr:ISSod4, transposase [Clostridium perfringens D str. JGS1721]
MEGYNRQLRKVTKTKTAFPTDEALLKILYLATIYITKKWVQSIRGWSQILAQLSIYFDERLDDHLY